jgi:hypothetical protein
MHFLKITSTMHLLLLGSVSLFCLTCLVACQNTAEPDQLTVVQGTVTSADSGRPLGGVLMTIESFVRGFYGATGFTSTGDSVRTDAQGKYQLSFRNEKGLYYAVSVEDLPYASSFYQRYQFVTDQTSGNIHGIGSGKHELTLGQTNTVDFRPNELRTVAVRIRNRNTGYQQLYFNYRYLRGNNLDTLAYLRGYYLEPAGVKFNYYIRNAAGQITKDTAVALVVQNPATLPPDTVRATLTFVR